MENFIEDERDIQFLTQTEVLSDGSVVYVARSQKVIGAIVITDEIRVEAADVIQNLRRSGFRVGIMTGDRKEVAKELENILAVDFVLSEVQPEDKMIEVQRLQKQGSKVVMVGDGMNDAPALAQADVGIALGSGTDIAIETADIVLVRSDLNTLVRAVQLSKKTLRIIKENLFWAFGYNAVGIPVAAGVLYPFWGILLHPVYAAAAMALSSVSVVLNSLRLKRTSLFS